MDWMRMDRNADQIAARVTVCRSRMRLVPFCSGFLVRPPAAVGWLPIPAEDGYPCPGTYCRGQGASRRSWPLSDRWLPHTRSTAVIRRGFLVVQDRYEAATHPRRRSLEPSPHRARVPVSANWTGFRAGPDR